MVKDLEKISEVLESFSPIALKEMDEVELLNRVDVKYILPVSQLPEILKKAIGQYRILTIGDKRMYLYKSLYFDTPELQNYFDHHNGIRPRFKVRFREYQDTHSTYLEVKRKINRDRTRKSRIPVDGIVQELTGKQQSYIQEHSLQEAVELSPSLWSIFRRITLIGIQSPERITLDLDLSFKYNGKETALPFLAICEVKRDQSRGFTNFMKILKSERFYPVSCSKYCLGTVLLKSHLKHNRFNISLRQVKKIENAHGTSPAAG